jgi:glycosyltransferase involved in cell wall biosynthesis
LNLKVCGDGFELEKLKDQIQQENIKNIEIEGFVEGEAKKAAFNWAHIFVFPSYGEGMPNAVLEAMGFGLPVITTPVGGVVDFFHDRENGFYIGIGEKGEIVDTVGQLVQNPELMKTISRYNFKMAASNFRSDRVAERMYRIFVETLKK